MSAKTSPKVGFVSLGCPKNLVDSEIMLGALSRHGYSITAQKEDADVIVVNTCGFIHTAQRESIDTILEMAERKVRGHRKTLLVAGCRAGRISGFETASRLCFATWRKSTESSGFVSCIAIRIWSRKNSFDSLPERSGSVNTSTSLTNTRAGVCWS